MKNMLLNFFSLRANVCAMLLCSVLLGLDGLAQTRKAINVVPTPLELAVHEGTFRLSPNVQLLAKGRAAKPVARLFEEKLQRATGWRLAKKGSDEAGTVVFRVDKSVVGKEAYRLDVTPQAVTAVASTEAGLFYALQTLLQLLPPDIEREGGLKGCPSIEIQALSINDAPRFVYRGVMLDPCRHFLSVDAVKQQIDRLSAYKINRIHWHLTDDQGWRIEIKKYPKLTEVGAVRVEGDGALHGGYYTQEEVKEVVEYARRRHIEIVPELEMPGHGLAAIAAYPHLACKGDSITPRIIWGVEDVVFCPGRETTFEFLKDVIDEMVPLFPGKLFHIGGDESPREEWAACKDCQQRKNALGLKRESQLQSYVVERIGDYLKTKGKTLIGWDEILEGGNLDTSAVVMSWRGEEGGITAASMGHPVLMTPSNKGFYFDQYQSDPATETTAIGGYTTLEKVYAYDPVPEVLKKQGKAHYVLGVQANCWSEYMHTPATLELRLYPRALALAEVGWSALSRKNYEDFVRRVDTDAALRLEAWGVNFHIPQPEQPGGSLNYMAFTDSAKLTLKTVRPLKIVYTTDGTAPTANSDEYTSPLTFCASTTVRTAAVLPCGIRGPVRTIYVDKQAFAPAVHPQKEPTPGALLSIWWGDYFSPYTLPKYADETKEVKGTEELRTQTRVPKSVRNVRNYAAILQGYVDIPADGVYEFSTNNNQLWIDGQPVVDNSTMPVPRYSPNNRQVALAKGLHPIKVVFLGGIWGGWPTYWDDASVKMRRVGEKWQKITPDMLSY